MTKKTEHPDDLYDLSLDAELTAMKKCVEALMPLTPEARVRVVRAVKILLAIEP